jgi:ribosomal protein L12E/L44/L45/RPP1/RPP2
MEELLEQLSRQPSVAEGGTVPPAAITEEGAAPPAAIAEEAAATEAQEEAPAEAGLFDIASILDAPTVTVVRSSV